MGIKIDTGGGTFIAVDVRLTARMEQPARNGSAVVAMDSDFVRETVSQLENALTEKLAELGWDIL